jgi:hypothetical protein
LYRSIKLIPFQPAAERHSMHPDHYRMTPEEFAAKYREYLDKDGAKPQG